MNRELLQQALDALRMAQVELSGNLYAGVRFSQVQSAITALSAALAAPPAAPAPGDMVMVPLKFVQDFNTLAHNYCLRAVPPDYYSGTEADAFQHAYSRCGSDLRRLREILAAAPAPAVPDGAVLYCGHPASLAVKSAETGKTLYCDLCDAKSGRRDAEQMEAELREENLRLREAAKSVAPAVPDLKHKPTVQRLMDLARKFRSAPGDLYDGAYKELQSACYEALSAAPVVREPQDERAAFEAWHSEYRGLVPLRRDDSYFDTHARLRWEGWQARAHGIGGGGK